MILALLLFVLAPAAAFGAADVADLPCILCHPSRDRATYEVLSQTPGVILGSESAQAFVCLSCHNGSVVDSRERLARGGQHPAGIPVSRPLPKNYPLYGNSRMECGTCHTPHGDGPGSRQWLRAKPDGSAPCAACHTGRRDRHLGMAPNEAMVRSIEKLGGRMGPGGEVVCQTCHSPHGARGDHLLAAAYGPDRDDLCRACHGALRVKGKTASAKPQGCASCHTPHGETPLLLAGGPKGPCLPCHTDHAGPSDHQAVTPACSECHSIHQPVLLDGTPGALLRMPLAGGLLCQPCHAGIVGPHRPTARLDSKNPELLAARGLSTGPAGELTCTTCHPVHGAKASPLLTMSGGLLCLYCHEGPNPYGAKGIKAGTHPIGVWLEDGQRKALGDPLGGGARAALTCGSCHTAHGERSQAPPGCVECHPSNAGGAGHGGVPDCAACHQIHGDVPASRGCTTTCHEGQVATIHAPDVRFGGGPFPLFDGEGRRVPGGALACPTCHDPHGANPRLLRSPSPDATCAACHSGKEKVRQGPHKGKGGDKVCASCHPPHRARDPEEADPAGANCTSCHPGQQAIHAHSPDGAPAWKGLEGRLPLFDRSGGRNAFGFITCPTCHDVHRDKGGAILRVDNADEPRLCLVCHGDKESILGTGHDPRQRGEKGVCGGCHPVHSKEGEPPLWTLRSEGKGGWNQRKCTPCHEEPGPKRERSGPAFSHPVEVSLSAGMKPSDLPLYDSLGNRPGRLIACATCHDIHGSLAGDRKTRPALLRKEPGDGTLCTTCHADQGAVRSTPHEVAPALRGTSRVGPCGPCHTPHGAWTQEGLWALPPAEGPYRPNNLCRSCHRQGGPVQSEFVLLQHHMKDAEPQRTPRGTIYLQWPMSLMDEWSLRTGKEPIIPLFESDEGWGPHGTLQCASCHDPHQWSPMGAFVKPGFGALGPNVPTRFLRIRDPKIVERSVCANCHKDDVIDRYVKYHLVWSDVGAEFH